MWYTAARAIFNLMKWLWLFVVASFLFTYAANIAPLPASQFFKTFYQSTFGWFFLPGPHLALTLIVLGVLLLLTLVAWLIARRAPQDDKEKKDAPVQVQQSHHNRGDSAQTQDGGQALIIKDNPGSTFVFSSRREVLSTQPDTQPQRDAVLNTYLDGVISQCQRINPTGIANPASQPLLSVSVPLEKIFIHLRAVSDRPRFGLAIEQQQIEVEIAALRERSDLPPDKLEEQIAGLKARLWQSELGTKGDNLTIKDVFTGITIERPVSLLLGGPGAGKSTIMRWLALQMARGTRSASSLPEKLAPAQIPLLVRISDYANYLEDPQNRIPKTSNVDGRAYLVKAFLRCELEKSDPALPDIMQEALANGQCLLLFDGLDEVASDALRRQIAADLYAFLTQHCPPQGLERNSFNRVLITSRIVGYEPGPLSQYREYTLLDLNDEQIEEFLTHWCPAVELFQATRQRDERDLTEQNRRQLQEAGEAERDRLLRAMRENPGIKRLAVNPLMLTILALIQKSGGKLPHRRIDLYNSVTQTLLDNWNQARGGRRFGHDELGLAENTLSVIAFEMHYSNLYLTREHVLGLARLSIAAFYHQSPQDIPQAAVKTFITTLSESSGLFVERGQGLFGFMHRTFQEYYAARYLLMQRNWTKDALIPIGDSDFTAFAVRHYHAPLWREPLLLAVASLSEQENRRAEANAIIRAILNAPANCDAILQRHLLFAVSCIVDCNPWYIDRALQHEIALHLLDIYGDNLGAGRYLSLQLYIEQLALLWLRGQPAENTIATPPLLVTWYAALCDISNPQRQEGAAHLLASIAYDLASCSKLVLLELVPPLLQLADVLDIPGIPDEMRVRLPDPPAHPAHPNIEDYAFVTLRLLDKNGPPGWLHNQWIIWDEEQPELLARLTQHALELNYLLTPAGFPEQPDNPDWQKWEEIEKNWKERVAHDPRELQLELLQASKAARYPYAFLLYQLLTGEATNHHAGENWKHIWDRCLEREMQRGRRATYQSCFYLRLMLAKDSEQQHRNITNALVQSISTGNKQQMQAITAIINIFLLDPRRMSDMFSLKYYRKTIITIDKIDLGEISYLIDPSSLRNLLELIDSIDLKEMSESRDLIYLNQLRSLIDRGKMSSLKNMGSLKDIRNLINTRFAIQLIDLKNLIDIRILLKFLRSLSDQPRLRVSVLLTLYSIISDREASEKIRQLIEQILLQIKWQEPLPLEQRLLLAIICSCTGITVPAFSKTTLPTFQRTVDKQAYDLDHLKQHMLLEKDDAESLFLACSDIGIISEQTWKSLKPERYYNRQSLGQLAWPLLRETWNMTSEAWQVVAVHLNDEDALTCGTAACLLQDGKNIPPNTCEQAKKQIQAILDDELRSRRPFDPPSGIWMSLSDRLFDALQALAERG